MREDGAEYRCVVRQATLTVAAAVSGRRTVWSQNLGADAAGEIVVREAMADLWGTPEDTDAGALDIAIVHVGRYRGASPHLSSTALRDALCRVAVGRHLLVLARTPEPYRYDEAGLWGHVVPHTVWACGANSALWVTRGVRPAQGRPSLVVVSPPRADTPRKPARRVVRKEER